MNNNNSTSLIIAKSKKFLEKMTEQNIIIENKNKNKYKCQYIYNDSFKLLFEHVKTIGRGSFGTVSFYDISQDYDNLKHNDTVVIKVIHATDDEKTNINIRKKFQKEVKIIQTMDACPTDTTTSRVLCILQCFEILDRSKTTLGFAIVSPARVNPVDLDEHILRNQDLYENPMVILDNIIIMRNILQSVRNIHSRGIVHIDLKPDNIIVHTINNKRAPLIIDFGNSCSEQDDECLRTSAGTLPFTPPEWFRRQMQNPNNPVSFQTVILHDIFSLGVTFYYLFSGHIPADDVPVLSGVKRENKARFGIIMSGLDKSLDISSFGDISIFKDSVSYRGINTIIKKMTALNSSERYQTIDEILTDLEKNINIKQVRDEAIKYIQTQ